MPERLQEWSLRVQRAGPAIALAIGKVATKIALDGERNAKINATTRMRKRTGHLRRSIQGRTKRASEDVIEVHVSAGGTAALGTIKYARIQELGGTVRPKTARMLAIPLGPALTAAGVNRRTSPRDNPNLVLIKSRAGRLLLIDKYTGVPFYVLKHQVEIKPKYYLRDGLKKAMNDRRPELDAAVAKVIEGPK